MNAFLVLSLSLFNFISFEDEYINPSCWVTQFKQPTQINYVTNYDINQSDEINRKETEPVQSNEQFIFTNFQFVDETLFFSIENRSNNTLVLLKSDKQSIFDMYARFQLNHKGIFFEGISDKNGFMNSISDVSELITVSNDARVFSVGEMISKKTKVNKIVGDVILDNLYNLNGLEVQFLASFILLGNNTYHSYQCSSEWFPIFTVMNKSHPVP